MSSLACAYCGQTYCLVPKCCGNPTGKLIDWDALGRSAREELEGPPAQRSPRSQRPATDPVFRDVPISPDERAQLPPTAIRVGYDPGVAGTDRTAGVVLARDGQEWSIVDDILDVKIVSDGDYLESVARIARDIAASLGTKRAELNALFLDLAKVNILDLPPPSELMGIRLEDLEAC